MTIQELKQKIEDYQSKLGSQMNGVVLFSETGPANMGLIRALFEVVARQQREIDELRRKVDGAA